MNESSLWQIFLNAALINNFVLAYFLGICPFLGVSGRLTTATRMGLAVTFVMVITSACAFAVHALLEWAQVPFLQTIAFVVVIASTVQFVEMVIHKFSPVLYRALGIYLPLITTNCAILGLALFQTNRGYSFVQGLVFAVGAGLGFTLALVLMAGIREKLAFTTVPQLLRGTAVTLIVAGILSLSFMGFAGMGS